MARRQAWMDERGWKLVLVHGEEANKVDPELWGALTDRGAEVLADPEGSLYRAFELGEGNLFQLFGPRVWLPGLRALLTGNFPAKTRKGVRQLPGAFVLHEGKVASSFRPRHIGQKMNWDRLTAGVS